LKRGLSLGALFGKSNYAILATEDPAFCVKTTYPKSGGKYF